jgi:ATP-dependent DNA helicase RecG
MTEQELLLKLDQLRKLPHETEWVEFKEANQSYDFKKLGMYFSALSNEANLKNQPCGWLVFGVRNDRSVCGSRFRQLSAISIRTR